MAFLKSMANKVIGGTADDAASPNTSHIGQSRQEYGKRMDDELVAWMKHFKLQNYADALFDAGLDSFAELGDIEDDDLEEIIIETKLPSLKAKKVRKAIQAVRSGNYVSLEEEEKRPAIPDRVTFAPGFHYIPCKRVRYSKAALRGSQKVISTGNNKIVMVVGQTGAGKTTFLNSLVNYVYNVQFEDKFRLKLIIEQEKKGGQAVSQTDVVSAYFIKKPKGSNIQYDLTVVDTPGFGDTRGIDQDKAIVANIKAFFENVLDSIDAVCFVVKATETRLTGSQKYIFNSVLNLWGKDVKENIFILMTFADAEDPPVLDAIKEQGTVAECEYFKLNNSVYKKDPKKMSSNKQAMIFDKMFWDMGTMCFDSLFAGLNKVTTKSVAHSREVLRERSRITTQIELMSKELDVALSEQQELEKQKRWIQDNKQDLDAYKEVVYYETKYFHEKVYQSSSIITTCRVCANRTCHPGCCVSNKAHCGVMGDGGYCTVCGCHYSSHENQNYIWEKRSKLVRKSNWDDNSAKKSNWSAAKSQMTRSERIIADKERALKNKQKKVTGLISFVHGCITKLEKIALRPVVTTVGDYIDKLISAEEENPQGKDEKRIRKLKDYKKMEKLIMEIERKGGKSIDIKELWKRDF